MYSKLYNKLKKEMESKVNYSEVKCKKHNCFKFHDENFNDEKILSCWKCIDEDIEAGKY